MIYEILITIKNYLISLGKLLHSCYYLLQVLIIHLSFKLLKLFKNSAWKKRFHEKSLWFKLYKKKGI